MSFLIKTIFLTEAHPDKPFNLKSYWTFTAIAVYSPLNTQQVMLSHCIVPAEPAIKQPINFQISLNIKSNIKHETEPKKGVQNLS